MEDVRVGRRVRRTSWRAGALGLVLGGLVLLVSGCGGNGGGPPDAAPGPAVSDTATGGDDGLLEPQAAPDKKLSFQGAGPGNGAGVAGDCVSWQWNGDSAGILSGGVAFVVTGVWFDPQGIATASRSGCEPGGSPWCEQGTRLTSDSSSCQFGVEAEPGVDTAFTAVVHGTIDCSQATEQRCAEAVATIRAQPTTGASIDPPPGTEDGSGGDEGSSSPTDATSSAPSGEGAAAPSGDGSSGTPDDG
ncbi:hypothetical protein [Luteimicrobium sp. DT211]|uniref:hypothetical protein n=1 Tax=Luteimicrobium sp. DT211 TaxID=3393412 RepID=UPI003CF7D184